jgi:uncharacterized membrane-anchored protein
MRSKAMAQFRYILAMAALFATSMATAQEQSEAEAIYANLNWQAGPGSFDVTRKASIDLPEGYDRLSASDTTALMELMENPSSGDEFYVGPEDGRWFAVFSYEDTGHVKDDEEIDADDLLDSIKEGTKYGNKARRERGWAEMNIIGWQYRPQYSDTTNRLSWAILAESEGYEIVNYNTRLLGRTGVISATLVAEPEILTTSVGEFEYLLDGFAYNSGDLYAEYKEGDKLATYGLAALVTGGAAAAVAKGAGKGLFKAIGLGILAFFAAIGKFFKGIFSRKQSA